MSDPEGADSYRAEIATRNRRYALESRERKLTISVFGLMAYSALGNFLGVFMTFAKSPADAVLALVLGVLYSLGAYRVWSKDDIRWWPVAVPAGISIALIAIVWTTGIHKPIPLLLNLVLLILVPIRRRAVLAIPNGLRD
jgi:hypothetical protein